MDDHHLDKTAAQDPSVAELSAQIETLKADLAGLAETIAALGKSKGAAFIGAARDEAESLKARGEEKVAHLQYRAQSLQAQAEDAVRTNPATSLGVAAGAGFLFGVILSRR